MFIAKVKNSGELIRADQALSNGQYYCPGCASDVCLKKGQINLPHFAHTKGAACSVATEGETTMHLQGKLDLFTFLSSHYDEVLLEPWLAKIKQRPDLMVRKGSKWLVVEFQCAPITTQKIKERTYGYQQLDLKVIWILGDTYRKKKIQARTYAKFATIYKRQLQIAFWPITGGLIWQTWWQMDGKTHVMERRYINNQPQQLLKLQQKVLQANPAVRELQNKLYPINRIVVGIPWICHPVYPLPGGLKIPQWQIISHILLALEDKDCTFNEIMTLFSNNDWQQFGSLSLKVVQKLWLYYLLMDLKQAQVITLSADVVSLTKPLVWFSTYQEKLANLPKKYKQV